MIAERLTVRLTPDDQIHVAALATRLQAEGAVFLSRSDVLREALRRAAGAMPIAGEQSPTVPLAGL